MKRNFIRQSVLDLDSYVPEPQEAEIVLNANENPYNLPSDLRKKISEEIEKMDFNRYPDPQALALKETFSDITGIPVNQLLAGNGLDEVLSIITSTFIDDGDVVVTHSPGFSMYQIWSNIAGGNVVEVEDTPQGKINVGEIVNAAVRNNAKIIFICSPNNPTGQTINLRDLEELLEAAPSIVVLDEAYVEFGDESFIDVVRNYDNLLVLRTMSKAFRSPAIRCGFAAGSVELIGAMNKVKAPYNLNSLTQKIAQTVLENREDLEPVLEEIRNQRDMIYDVLAANPDISVLPSKGNFLYFTTPKHEEIQKALLDRDILLRYYPDREAFRFTVGTPEENKEVLEVIKEVTNAPVDKEKNN